MRTIIKKIYIRIKILILQIFSVNSFASSFYYFLLSNAFRREHLAVIRGRVKYYKQNIIEKNGYYLLRRNIHRLEKGLIMKNRRPLFALEYIEETVEAYVKVISADYQEKLSTKNLKWYSDVLQNYFDVVDLSNPKIKEIKLLFEKHKVRTEIKKSVPYKRDFELLKVTYTDFLKLNTLRRAVRWYENKPVPRELLDKAIQAATLSPSACNRQPFEFRIYDDYELVQKVANITWGTRGFSQNFQVIVVVVGKLEAYFDERDRHIIYIDASLASMTFMLALETLGLSSCPINWPDVGEFEQKMENILGIEKNERPVMLISCGYPDKNALVAYSEKKDLFELRNYNKLKNK